MNASVICQIFVYVWILLSSNTSVATTEFKLNTTSSGLFNNITTSGTIASAVQENLAASENSFNVNDLY